MGVLSLSALSGGALDGDKEVVVLTSLRPFPYPSTKISQNAAGFCTGGTSGAPDFRRVMKPRIDGDCEKDDVRLAVELILDGIL